MGLFETKPTKNQGITCENRASEHGNVMIWILVAVALFAALNYVTSQGSRTSAGNFSEEVATLAANEIMEYGQTMRRVVQELQISGCDETEISFENTFVSGYLNANAPTDETCHVFSPSGGGLRYAAPEVDFLDGGQSSRAQFREWFFTQKNTVDGVGTSEGSAAITTDNEILIILPWINQQICLIINEKLGVGNPSGNPPIDPSSVAISTHKFDGNFNSSNRIGDAVSALEGKQTACFEATTDAVIGAVPNTYHFYQTLVAR